MKFTRYVAALAVLAVAVVAAQIVLDEPTEPAPVVAAAVVPSPTTTAEDPDFAALVASGPSYSLPPEELSLTEEAVSRATSTTTSVTSSTTTTTTSSPSQKAADTATATSKPQATTTTTQASSGSTGASQPTTTTPPTTEPPPSGGSDPGHSSATDKEFATAINGYRSTNGLSSLTLDSSLSAYARSWAKTIADNGGLSHSAIGSLLPPWSAVGENVAMGHSVSQIHQALVDSTPHRDTMLGDFTHLGVGTWVAADGRIWTAHVFAR